MAQDIQLSVSTVMAGQELTDLNTGAKSIAVVDLVLLGVVVGGEQTSALRMQVGQAMELARELSKASSSILAAGVDDDGKPLSLSARINILTGGTP